MHKKQSNNDFWEKCVFTFYTFSDYVYCILLFDYPLEAATQQPQQQQHNIIPAMIIKITTIVKTIIIHLTQATNSFKNPRAGGKVIS